MVEKRLMMVGPTAIPKRVIEAMDRTSISHRSPEYVEVHKRVTDGMKKLFGTKNDVYLLTSSGTGAMEAALQNCFSFGDEVVVAVLGTFSKQFAEMAQAFNLKVIRVEVELGKAVQVDELMKHVTPNTKGVFVVHNESSTGVFNDLEAIGKEVNKTDALFICDSVSGAGGLEVKMDEWGIDILLSSSQKALMVPAGLAFLSLSEKAWKRVESSDIPKFYFDAKKMRDFQEKNQTPNTPAVYNVFAVDQALKMLFEEGIDNVYKRHEENTQAIIDGVRKLGLDIFPQDDKYASRTLTAVYAKGRSKEIVAELAKDGIIVNGGLPPVADDVFRVGTMGHVYKEDVDAFLESLARIVK